MPRPIRKRTPEQWKAIKAKRSKDRKEYNEIVHREKARALAEMGKRGIKSIADYKIYLVYKEHGVID